VPRAVMLAELMRLKRGIASLANFLVKMTKIVGWIARCCQRNRRLN